MNLEPEVAIKYIKITFKLFLYQSFITINTTKALKTNLTSRPAKLHTLHYSFKVIDTLFSKVRQVHPILAAAG